jgi:hypothetical protein
LSHRLPALHLLPLPSFLFAQNLPFSWSSILWPNIQKFLVLFWTRLSPWLNLSPTRSNQSMFVAFSFLSLFRFVWMIVLLSPSGVLPVWNTRFVLWFTEKSSGLSFLSRYSLLVAFLSL